MQLTELISAIQTTHEYTQRFAVQQTNVALTIRNWVIGFYIVEYEQQGEDRAEYGDRIMKELANRLKQINWHLPQTSPMIQQSSPPELLLSRLSFSHFIELIRADTPLKRAFYEVQAIKNNWS